MKVEIVGKNLVITLPLQQPKLSTSGKSLVIATTAGNKDTECKFEGKTVMVGANAYVSAK